jgi:hypothetical protein
MIRGCSGKDVVVAATDGSPPLPTRSRQISTIFESVASLGQALKNNAGVRVTNQKSSSIHTLLSHV